MRGKPVLFSDFTKGLDTKSAPYQVEDGAARDLLNVTAVAKGSVRKRDGSSVLATAGTTLTGLYPLEVTATKYLIGSGGTVLYSIDAAGTVTTIKTGMTNAAKWWWVSAPSSGGQGPLYGVNGTDAQQWDGSAATTSAWTATSGNFPTGGKYLASLGNRVWAANVTANGSRLQWSQLGDPRVWPAQNSVDLDPNDGDQITGIGTFGPYLLVFKGRKTWVVYDWDTGANRRLSANVGCIAPRSIVETPFGAFFLTPDQGVYRTNGQTLDQVSQKITPTLDALVPSQRAEAAGGFFNDHYYLSVCTAGTTLNRTLDLDLQLGSWWQHSFAGTQLTRWRSTSDVPLFYSSKAGSGVANRLLVPGVLTDEGANFTAYWTGPWHTYGAPYLRKRLRQVHFDGTGAIQFTVAKSFSTVGVLASDIDFSTNVTTFGGTDAFGGVGTFGDPVAVGEARAFTLGVARAWSVQFGNSTNLPFEVDSYTTAITTRRN